MKQQAKEKAKTKKLTGNRAGADRWREVLFRPGQIIGFKETVDSRLTPLPNERSEFFVLNPLKNLQTAFDANVASFQNILLELDWRGLQAQEKQVEQFLDLPFTMKTYSGGKSLHYIISLSDPMQLEEWRDVVKFLLFAVKRADPKCKNPARLTRTPNIMRDGTTCQTLIHCEPVPLPTNQFRDWLNSGRMLAERIVYDVKLEHEAAIRAKQREVARSTGAAPAWVDRLLADPTKHVIQGSRHATIVNVAVTLYSAGFDLETYIEPRLMELALALDKSEQEVYSILNWVERNVQIGND